MLGGEGVNTTWIKPLPVLPGIEEYDGNAAVPQLPNDLSGFLVSRDIPIHELNVQIIQSFFSEAAGKASRRRENGDQDGSFRRDGKFNSIA